MERNLAMLTVVVLVTVLSVACERRTAAQPVAHRAVKCTSHTLTVDEASPCLDAGLTADELTNLPQQALLGDAAAAYRLSAYYEQFQSEDQAAYWSRIELENGSASAMWRQAGELEYTGGLRNCSRALFWYRRAAQINPKEFAEEPGRLQRRWNECVAKNPASPSSARPSPE